MNLTFQPATRHEAKARVAMIGPTGSGKTVIAAAIVNMGACLIWFVASSYGSPATAGDLAAHLLLQLLLAGVVGTIGLVPIALTQNATLDRLSIPPAPDTP